MNRLSKTRAKAFSILGAFGSDTRGSVAIEFGVFAAMLAPILVLAVDIGLVLRERIVMDHTVRAGVFAAAREGATRTSVEDAIQAAFDAQDRSRVSLAELSVAESCFCPDAPATEVSCASSCAPARIMGAYTISLAITHDSILLTPGVQSGLGMLSSRARVEFPAWAR